MSHTMACQPCLYGDAARHPCIKLHHLRLGQDMEQDDVSLQEIACLAGSSCCSQRFRQECHTALHDLGVAGLGMRRDCVQLRGAHSSG